MLANRGIMAKVLNSVSSKGSARTKNVRSERTRRLLLETLEQRQLLAVLSDVVWDDVNGNSLRDEVSPGVEEPGIPLVVVNLYSDNGDSIAKPGVGNGLDGAPIQTTTTAADGRYTFDVEPGDYFVEVVAPGGKAFSSRGGDSDVDSRGLSDVFILDETSQLTNVGMLVDNYADAQAQQDLVLGGVGSTSEAATGSQESILGGERELTLEYLSGRSRVGTSLIVGPNGSGHGEFRLSTAPRVTAKATVVWDGTGTAGDPGNLNGLNADLTRVGLDDRMNLRFLTGDLPATITVTIEDTSGNSASLTASTPFENGETVMPFLLQYFADNSVDVTSVKSVRLVAQGPPAVDVVTCSFSSGNVSDGVAAGLVGPSEEPPYQGLGDYVWHDLNADGIQNDGNTGINGVTVKLLDRNGVLIDTMITVDDASGNPGYYLFTDLPEGLDYLVEFETPAGYQVSPSQTVPDSAKDSDGLVSGPVSLAIGEFNETIDSGFYQYASLGNYVWEDSNGNGIQDDGDTGINGATVNLLDGDGNLVTTTVTANHPDSGDPGYYVFTGLTPGVEYKVEFVTPAGFDSVSPRHVGSNATVDSDGLLSDVVTLVSGEFNETIDSGFYRSASLGNLVWDDSNADGIQDAGEPGINGATVNLLYANLDPVLDGSGNPVTAVTANDPVSGDPGYYKFTDLTPGVQYKVQFVTPSGFDLASPRQTGATSPALDSDGLISDAVRLQSGQYDDTIDSGFYEAASLGNYVWIDSNADGIQDSGETGLNGVTVKLLDGAGNPILVGGVAVTAVTADDGSGNPGFYEFTGLTPGDYKVEFVAPSGYLFSPQNQGGDDTKDSDADPTTGVTAPVTLGSGESNLTVDAGLVPPAPGINVVKVADDTLVAPFEEVTYTYTVTNVGGIPLDNVTVVDDNATPSYAEDDFNPTYVSGDTNNDGKLDVTETWTYTATVIPPVTYVADGGTNDGQTMGQVVTTVLPSGDYRFDVIYDDGVNDNRWGTGSNDSELANPWPGNGRTWSQLVGSDNVYIRLNDGSNASVMEFRVDYLSRIARNFGRPICEAGSTAPGVGTCEVWAGGIGEGIGDIIDFGVQPSSANQNDGVLNSGNSAWFLSTTTSMMENLQAGFDINNTMYPTTAAAYPGEGVPGYEYRMIYTFVIDDAAFGSNGLGDVEILGMHNSPPKAGYPNGDQKTKIVPHTATNTATVSGVSASATTVTDTDTATVTVDPSAPAGGQGLLLVGGDGGTAETLDVTDLETTVEQAVAMWQATGLTDEQYAALEGVQVQITDLDGTGLLGYTASTTVVIDDDGGGLGWIVDSTVDSSSSDSGVDLLTVVLHELGHIIGYSDDESGLDVMGSSLAAGDVRRLAEARSSLTTAARVRFAGNAADDLIRRSGKTRAHHHRWGAKVDDVFSQFEDSEVDLVELS